jgi:hypothetical protein
MMKFPEVSADIEKGALYSEKSNNMSVTGLKILSKSLTVLRCILLIGSAVFGVAAIVFLIICACIPLCGACYSLTGAIFMVFLFTPIPSLWAFVTFCINPFIKFLQRKVAWELSKRAIPDNPPFDLRKALTHPADIQGRLNELIPDGYSLGGTKELVVKSEINARAKTGPTMYLHEIVKNGMIIGYIAQGARDGIYHYIGYAPAHHGLWKAGAWQQIANPIELNTALANAQPPQNPTRKPNRLYGRRITNTTASMKSRPPMASYKFSNPNHQRKKYSQQHKPILRINQKRERPKIPTTHLLEQRPLLGKGHTDINRQVRNRSSLH